MRENPKPFEIYQHFKGNQYQILTLAKDSEDSRDLVVYQALYGDYAVYVRDLAQFMSPVDKAKYPEASQEYRFEKKSKAEARVAAAAEQSNETDAQPDEAEAYLDPDVAAFLDADSYDKKLDILAGLHNRITEDMLAIMAVATDIELNEGSLEERYSELKNCLLTMEKFECDRIR
ncbi:MAG: DUF1653 domain-containing protein [Lachnospiraceae bacterium]